jgi:hypothetical protein
VFIATSGVRQTAGGGPLFAKVILRMMNRSTDKDLRGIEAERITWTGEIFLKDIIRRVSR